MKILSALFDTVLLGGAVVKDVFDISNAIDGKKSYTRQKIEDIEKDLKAE